MIFLGLTAFTFLKEEVKCCYFIITDKNSVWLFEISLVTKLVTRHKTVSSNN